MGRTLVLGDVHGARRALDQVLVRSGFEQGVDRVVFLGDVCDGWPDVTDCISTLLAIGAECVWGNHDVWAWEWMVSGYAPPQWVMQGGSATLQDIGRNHRAAHAALAPYFDNLRDYIHDADRNHLYVHAGIPVCGRVGSLPDREFLTWDRTLFLAAANGITKGIEDVPLTGFSKVFIGHTTTTQFSDVPVSFGGVVLLDQGAGWEGKLSIMDADTGEFWQSDKVSELYPEHNGRMR